MFQDDTPIVSPLRRRVILATNVAEASITVQGTYGGTLERFRSGKNYRDFPKVRFLNGMLK